MEFLRNLLWVGGGGVGVFICFLGIFSVNLNRFFGSRYLFFVGFFYMGVSLVFVLGY